MNPITLEIDGVVLTLKKITKNKVYTCKRDCWNNDNCDLKHKLSFKSVKNSLTATEVIYNIRNLSNTGWSISTGDWELIDNEGYAYRASELCEELQPQRVMIPGTWTVSPGTQVDFLLLFPQIEDEKEISKILYVDGSSLLAFKLKEMSPEAQKLFEVREEALLQEELNNNWELKNIQNSINKVSANIHARLNNVLSSKEAIKLENSISNEIFSIRQKLLVLSDKKKEMFEANFENAIKDYYEKLENLKEKELEYKKLDQKISQLYELDPREFEEYTAELLKTLGYERVTLTPSSNDKGVDILAEKNGLRVAVQCKKYKGVVGSPVIQTFIGAMQHAEVHKGLFITTGTFSSEAEKMAENHPIELYDRGGLAELIKEALS